MPKDWERPIFLHNLLNHLQTWLKIWKIKVTETNWNSRFHLEKRRTMSIRSSLATSKHPMTLVRNAQIPRGENTWPTDSRRCTLFDRKEQNFILKPRNKKPYLNTANQSCLSYSVYWPALLKCHHLNATHLDTIQNYKSCSKTAH